MKFYKYQGAGNDFILIDNRNGEYNIYTDTVQFLCNRRFGVGADGVIILLNTDVADFKVRILNSDGSEASMCGNGARCVTGFANKIGLIEKKATFMCGTGKYYSEIISKSDNCFEVCVKFVDICGIKRGEGYYFLNTGVPHCVIFVDNLSNIDIISEGKRWRHSSLFGGRTNVNFVQILENNNLKIRTFECGVEDETLACGTGAVASAIVTADVTGHKFNSYNVQVKGGKLGVSFEKDESEHDLFKNVYLQGPAKFVFSGEL